MYKTLKGEYRSLVAAELFPEGEGSPAELTTLGGTVRDTASPSDLARGEPKEHIPSLPLLF